MSEERDGAGEGEARHAPPTLTKELLARYLAGDLDAERRLFELRRAELVERARRHRGLRALRERTAAEDAVQEVFWRALSSGLFARFEDRGPGSLDAALRVVLDRTIVDMRRRFDSKKRGTLAESKGLGVSGDGLWLGELLPADDPTPTASASAEDLVALARRLLSEREWHIWRSIDVEGSTPIELARELGESPAAIRGVLHRARERLKPFLSSGEEEREPRG